jgi:hypothetical protein
VAWFSGRHCPPTGPSVYESTLTRLFASTSASMRADNLEALLEHPAALSSSRRSAPSALSRSVRGLRLSSSLSSTSERCAPQTILLLRPWLENSAKGTSENRNILVSIPGRGLMRYLDARLRALRGYRCPAAAASRWWRTQAPKEIVPRTSRAFLAPFNRRPLFLALRRDVMEDDGHPTNDRAAVTSKSLRPGRRAAPGLA